MRLAGSVEDCLTVRRLSEEYASRLGSALEFQGFAAELERLPGEYAPPGGPGTASEVALALKCGKPVVLLAAPRATGDFVRALGGRSYAARSAQDTIALIRREKLLDR